MTTNRVISLLFLKVLTPLALILCVYMKQNIMMSVYWMFLLVAPFIAYSSKFTTRRSRSTYVTLLLFTSLLMLIFLIVFQFLPDQYQLTSDVAHLNSSATKMAGVVENFGFIDIRKLHGPFEIFVYIFPDIFMFLWASLNVMVVGVRLPMKTSFNIDHDKLLMTKFIVLLILGLTGSMFPSWIHMIYFLVFIIFFTFLSFGYSIDRCFGHLCQALAVFVMAHSLLIFFYQMKFIQSFIPKETYAARVFGMKSWKSLEINEFGLVFSKFDCYSHLQLPLLLLLYYLLVYQGIITFKTSRKSIKTADAQTQNLSRKENFMSSLKDFLFPRPQYCLETIHLATNAAMMVWSALYRHWLSLILLLWVSLMWVFKKRRVMNYFAHGLVLYSIILLMIQYVYCMDFTDEELPPDVNEIGLNKKRADSGPIIIKSLFVIVFWTNLYVCISVGQKSKVSGSEMLKLPFQKTREFIRNILSQIWFSLIILLLFLIGLLGHYMHLSRILCTCFALLFCVSIQNYMTYSVSLRLRYILCVALIVCSMFLLTLVYTYQFRAIAQFWDLVIPDKIKHVIGIASLKADIITTITKLTFVVISVSVYVNVLHKPTAPLPENILHSFVQADKSNTELKDPLEKESRLYRLHLALNFIVHYLNIHKLDFIWLAIVICILQSDVGFTRLMCLILSAIGLCLPIKAQIFVVRFISLLLSGFTFLFVLYQLPSSYMKLNTYTNRAQNEHSLQERIEKTVEYILAIFGFFKTTDVFSELIGYVLIISIITFCEDLNHVQHPYSLFPNVTYFDTDDSLVSCLKYLANYGFYRFSLEVCFISMLVSIASRISYLSMVMLIWLTLFISLRRSLVNRIWRVFIAYQIPMIPLQYFVLIKDCPVLRECMMSIMSFMEVMEDIFQVIGIRYHNHSSGVLFYDFIILFLSLKHLRIIQLESKLLIQNKKFAGGSNTPLTDFESAGINITRNFYQYMHSSLDIIKSYLFGTSFWVTLTLVFVIYKGQPYIFSLGYMTSVFLLLWLGNEFYLKSQRQILKYVHLLIYYTLAVMFTKMTLLVTHSETLYFHESCNYIEFFVPITSVNSVYRLRNNGLKCQIDRKNINLFWDAVCLLVFLIQKRIFRSYHFLHVVTETKYNAMKASRGLEKMLETEQKNYKRYKEQIILTYEQLNKVIATQNASQRRRYIPRYHHEAMSAGDYYMFPIEENRPQTNMPWTSRRNTTDNPDITENKTMSVQCWKYVNNFIEKLMKILIHWLNEQSKSYRAIKVAYQKEKEEFYKNVEKLNEESNLKDKKVEDNVIELTFVNNNALFRTEEIVKISEKQRKVSNKETNLILQLYFSIYYAIISNTTIVTYAVIILHQATTASLLTLPISLLLFLWGSLTVPRPSVNFWILLIIYVEIMIAIKFIFSFDTIKWNNIDTNEVFLPPKFVGIEQVSFMDIILLLTLFHHRHVLKSWGLWAQSVSPESNKRKFLEESSNILANCWQSLKQYLKPLTEFIVSVLKAKRKNIKKDVYFYLFLCDFFVFVILFAKFDSFVSPDEGMDVSEYFKTQQGRRFTISYVSCLITQFCLILIDRVLYLRRFLKGKIVFDIVQIVTFHVLIFFVHPIFTNKYFKESLFPRLIYIVKSSYFAISAYIIRHGYTKTMLGNMIQQEAGIINKYVYRAYFLVPFLHEMRTIMDWIWTDTSMSLGEWFRFEDIHAQLFLIRCDINYNESNPDPRGTKYPWKLKYLHGFSILILIVFCIWSPILLFTDYGFNKTVTPDLPIEFKITIRLGSYPPMYTQTIHKSQIVPISDGNYNLLKQQYTNSTEARKVFKVFNPSLVFLAPLDPGSLWQISPDQAGKLEKDLNCNSSKDARDCELKMILTVEMIKATSTVTDSHSIVVPDVIKSNLSQAFFGKNQTNGVQVRNLYPKFVRSASENVFLVELMSLKSGDSSEQDFFDVNITMNFYPEGTSLKSASKIWTTVLTDYSNMRMAEVFDEVPCLASQDPVYIVVFNYEDSTSSSGAGIINSALSMLRTKGLLWIYSSYVVFLSLRVMRKILTRSVESIIVEELPYVDRLWQLCIQIYIAREMKDLTLEEDLFARLLFLFRSPETLIANTRPLQRASTM